MFVEKLTKEQLWDFIKTLKDYENAVDINLSKEAWCDGIIFFTVEFSQKPKFSTPSVITATDTKFAFHKNEDWIKYLYSIFGEEYKLWYKNKLEEEFKRLFLTPSN